jgi:hypothetical protein
MRWCVVVVVHGDHNSEKSAEFRHQYNPDEHVRDNFHWRGLRDLGKLLAYVLAAAFSHARSTRWKSRRKCRRNSSPSR